MSGLWSRDQLLCTVLRTSGLGHRGPDVPLFCSHSAGSPYPSTHQTFPGTCHKVPAFDTVSGSFWSKRNLLQAPGAIYDCLVALFFLKKVKSVSVNSQLSGIFH